MPPPSKLMIATSVLNRLVKEEASYHKEHEHQTASIVKLEQSSLDEDAEYVLRQERKALEETEAIFPRLKQSIRNALQNLESQVQDKSPDQSTPEEIVKAREAIAAAKAAIGEDA